MNEDADDTQAADSPTDPKRSLVEVLTEDELTFLVEPRRGTDQPVDRLVAECEQAGASAVSLSIDAGFVRSDLAGARAGCLLPIIARGGIHHAAHVRELREIGADAVMMPAAAWLDSPATGDDHDHSEPDDDTLAGILRAARAHDIEVVLTVRSDEELELALEADVDAINIDNRASDGSVDVERTFELLAQVPAGWPVISESIASLEQVARLHRAGVDALLLDEGHLDTGLSNALEVYAHASREGG